MCGPARPSPRGGNCCAWRRARRPSPPTPRRNRRCAPRPSWWPARANWSRAHLATRQQLVDAEKSQSDARAALAALQAQGADGPHILRAPSTARSSPGCRPAPGALVALGAALHRSRPSRTALVLMAGAVPAQAAGVKPPATRRRSRRSAGARPLPGRSSCGGLSSNSGTGLVPVDITLPPRLNYCPGEMASSDHHNRQNYGYVLPHEAILVMIKARPMSCRP